ncbi:hypothetical protein ACFV0C_22800 [Streptomyces sp. NPDC059568]|uniref:hypothetical protein n=1 Tax=Streptomyces sp. NPDC059568 TaxID=3346868 RepID=UPI0036C0FDE9
MESAVYGHMAIPGNREISKEEDREDRKDLEEQLAEAERIRQVNLLNLRHSDSPHKAEAGITRAAASSRKQSAQAAPDHR